MVEVHILLNMFLSVISCEIIRPMPFEILGFERNWDLSQFQVFKVELNFQNNSTV